jgi:hypothetical protein
MVAIAVERRLQHDVAVRHSKVLLRWWWHGMILAYGTIPTNMGLPLPRSTAQEGG